MNDVFVEQIVKKRATVKDNLIKSAILFVAVILASVFFMFVPSQFFGGFALLLAVGSLVFAWYLMSGMNLEYEYIFTNGEIDIDKISAKRKRKRVLTVAISSFDDFGKYDAEKIKSHNIKNIVEVCESLSYENTYYAVFRGKDGNNHLLVFTPNERFITEIQKYYRKRVR